MHIRLPLLGGTYEQEDPGQIVRFHLHIGGDDSRRVVRFTTVAPGRRARLVVGAVDVLFPAPVRGVVGLHGVDVARGFGHFCCSSPCSSFPVRLGLGVASRLSVGLRTIKRWPRGLHDVADVAVSRVTTA